MKINLAEGGMWDELNLKIFIREHLWLSRIFLKICLKINTAAAASRTQ